MSKKDTKFHLTETQRTILLLIVLALAIGFIIWTQNQYETNFTESF